VRALEASPYLVLALFKARSDLAFFTEILQKYWKLKTKFYSPSFPLLPSVRRIFRLTDGQTEKKARANAPPKRQGNRFKT